ncbi:MAG: hypothetical protein O3C09_01915 [Proteobacteria bacterium]|nr:hypothetical protein [Pseudomonadota bacterium]
MAAMATISAVASPQYRLRWRPRNGGRVAKPGRTSGGLALLMFALVLGSGCAVTSETAAQDQNEYEQYVADQLDVLCEYAECWWLDYWTSFYGTAEAGGTASHYIDLQFDFGYLFIAVYDQDCTDIDLLLYDPAGTLVASDTAVNAYPDLAAANAEVYFDAEAGGTYRLDIRIYGCGAANCYYGVDVGLW